MEEIKEEKKISKKTIIFLILSLMSAIMIILIIAVLSNLPDQKKTESELGYESNPAQQEEVLGNLNPFARDADVSQEITKEQTVTSQISDSGQGGSGSIASSPVISSSSSDNKNFSSKGSLEINNIINRNYTSSNLGLAHYPGANESFDKYDSRYYAMFDPSGIASKIISKNTDLELDADIRPPESNSDFYIELSLVSQSKGDIKIKSFNLLRISLPLEGYDFKDKNLILQQYNLNNPQAEYPKYNLKDKISEGNGVFILTLNNLSGTYKSEEPYAYFKISIN